MNLVEYAHILYDEEEKRLLNEEQENADEVETQEANGGEDEAK